MSAEVNAETLGFSRRALGGRTNITRDADDAGLLAEKIKGLDRFLGKANDPLRREHPSAFSNLNEQNNTISGRDRSECLQRVQLFTMKRMSSFDPKRTLRGRSAMSSSDPKQTSGASV